ncbi:MAG: RlmE family RNA methyltransferase [Chromatiales bacterium]
MSRSSSSERWLREHGRDLYVQKAKRAGYRSRAAYKLAEIDRRDRLLRPGLVVVDLGAAPGGWSQVACERIGSRGVVVAVDVLEMASLAGVTFIRGDFTEPSVLQEVLATVGDGVDLVLSDMAPNMSGMKALDQARIMRLAESALAFAEQALRPGGDLLVKAFYGEGLDEFLRALRGRFAKVATRKPQASRGRSSETYLLARGYGQ